MNKEMARFQKCDFFAIFPYIFTIIWVASGAPMCLLNIRFALFVAKMYEKQFVN